MISVSRLIASFLFAFAVSAVAPPAPAPQGKMLAISEPELRAAAIQKVEPEYPAVARQIRLTGSVDLELVIDETGSVEKITSVRGNTLLTGPSLQAIRKWKFKPFSNGPEPAKASGPIKFTFQM